MKLIAWIFVCGLLQAQGPGTVVQSSDTLITAIAGSTVCTFTPAVPGFKMVHVVATLVGATSLTSDITVPIGGPNGAQGSYEPSATLPSGGSCGWLFQQPLVTAGVNYQITANPTNGTPAVAMGTFLAGSAPPPPPPPPPPPSVIAFVQKNFAGGYSGTATAAFPANNAARCLIVASVEGLTGNTFTVTDTQGNIYVPTPASDYPTGGIKAQLFYALNCKTGANAVHVVGSLGSLIGIKVSEYSGLTALDQFSALNGYGGSPIGPTLMTTAPGLVYGAILMTDAAELIGSGFTTLNSDGGNNLDEYQIKTTAGSIPVQFISSYPPGGVWTVLAASFK